MTIKSWDDCSPAEQIERWQHAEQVLRRMTPHEREKHWNMGIWGEKNECGTVACAAGQCGLDPWFRRRGFKLDFERHVSESEVWDKTIGDWKKNAKGEFVYEKVVSYSAIFEETDVPLFFGNRGTSRIFYNSRQRPVEAVIAEIQEYVQELKEEAAE